MADDYLPLNSTELKQLLRVLWGDQVNPEVFKRWSQGFVFSDQESSALVQYEGGPCSIIASVEAFLLKNLLFVSSARSNWRQLTSSEQNTLLCSSLCDILQQVGDNNSFNLVLLSSASFEFVSSNEESIKSFHENLKIRRFSNLRSLQSELISNLRSFYSDFGCILFLYSLLLTKGLEKVREEVGDGDESLIDPVHGHGTQSLINLLITGKAVSYVWDDIKEVSGLKLQGISAKPQVGFLTLLEHLRYCEVGWFLKNPLYPIWILGSETHLTVFFSEEKSLVGDEDQQTVARRAFDQFDKEGRGFIDSDSLLDVMKSLELFADPDYVKVMLTKLDQEQLGIVTLNDFLEEFYPRNNANDSCRKFVVYHYNGLQRSSSNSHQVSYREATCTIKDMPELQMISDFSPIKTCLLTKWPTIEINWKDDVIPSLN